METEEKIVNIDVHESFVIKTDAGELCRLCANTDNQFIPIFRGEGLEHNISVKIETHLPIIKVTEADKLPLQICYQCASTLISWHNLYEGSRVADKRLREILAVDDRLFQEDDSCGDFADDFRDNYDDDTPENLPTETPNTSNLESNMFKDNPTEIPTLSETKSLINETELQESDERYLRWSDCDSGDDDNRSDHLNDYDYEYYYNDRDDRLTKVAQRSTSKKRQKQQQRRRSAKIPRTREGAAISSKVIDDDGLTGSSNDLCDCVLSRARCQRCSRLNRFKCYYCPMVFLRADERNHHLRVSHRKELLMNSFELFYRVGQHIGEDKGKVADEVIPSIIENSEYECDKCADQFNDKVTLIEHLSDHGEREKQIETEENDVYDDREITDDEIDDGVTMEARQKYISIAVARRCARRSPNTVVSEKKSSRSYPIVPENTSGGSTTYECANCAGIFSSKVEIRKHLSSVHDFKSPRASYGLRSSAVKKEEAKLIQELAKKSFKRAGAVVPAGDTETASQISQTTAGYYICAVCGQIFLKRHSFTRHVNQHSSSRLDCDKCKKSFTTENALLSHQNLKHKDLPKNVFFLNGRKYLKCEQCSFTCRNERNKMEEHMRVHTGEKPFTCELCGKQFRTRALLRVHTKYVHEGIKEHACDICGRCFSNKRYMEEHRRIHTGEKPLICDLCGKTFRQNSSLAKHVENHLGIKRHGCQLCGKRFSNSHHLTIHIKRHMGEANYVCDQCGKGFVDQYQLKNHKVVHSEERPFVCMLCGTGFKLLKHLKQHGRTHKTC